jgi:hypothetical protein
MLKFSPRMDYEKRFESEERLFDSATMNARFFREGEILAGKYRVERLLRQAGMAVVLAARHIHLEARVAVKFPAAVTLDGNSTVAR